MKPLLLAFFFISSVSSLSQVCTNETIAVTSQWTLPLTNLADQQYCIYSFAIPQGSFASVDFEANNLNGTSIYISDAFGNVISRGANLNFSESLAFPGNFKVHIQTRNNTQVLLKMNVISKKATPTANFAGFVITNLNSPSSVVYFDQWKEGTSFSVTSLHSLVNLKVALNYLEDINQLENVFVYDNGFVVDTLLGVLTYQGFVSKTNQLTIYMAKKVTITNGALLVMDNSNVQNFENHGVAYVNEEPKTWEDFYLEGGEKKEGAFTFIGSSDGSALITITLISYMDSLNGTISYSTGGPVANHSNATVLTKGDLPKLIPGILNTFYISKGAADLIYVVNK